MLRKAGDLFAQFNDEVREGRLSANRSQPIGAGSYGVVYQSDVPGRVIKQKTQWDGLSSSFEREANLQAIAADMGIAPRVHSLEKFIGGVGDRIEMADVRQNFENAFDDDAGDLYALRKTDLRVAQQLGQLALKGVRLEDRHPGNVYKNKMTGRPMQLDFGIAGKMSSDQQAAYLAHVTAEGFEAAGIGDMGSILRATVMDYLESGQVKEAMDIAKQGFSRLQKIKAPLKGDVSFY